MARIEARVLTYPQGGSCIVPVATTGDNEGLACFLLADSVFFRGNGFTIFESVLGGDSDSTEIIGNRTRVVIQAQTTTISDPFGEEAGIAFPLLVLATTELRDWLLWWHGTENEFHQTL